MRAAARMEETEWWEALVQRRNRDSGQVPNPRDCFRQHYRVAGSGGVGLLFLLLVVVLVLLAGCLDALAQSGSGRNWAAAPIAATVTVAAPSKDLPAEIAELEIEVKQLAPLPLRELVGLVADLAGVEASIQERPGRVLDGDLRLEPPVPFGLSMRGTVPSVLDELARLSGYDWGWEDGRLLFYRYGDIEQRRPERVPGGISVDVLAAVAGRELPETKEGDDAEGRSETGGLASEVPGELEPGGRPVDPDAVEAVEGQEETSPEGEVPAEPLGWQVIPEVHGTVEAVLRAWADRAGWQVAWKSERQFKVGAAAEFPAGETLEAGFLAAADALLAIGPMRRALSATAYPNKWLVIQDVGSFVQ